MKNDNPTARPARYFGRPRPKEESRSLYLWLLLWLLFWAVGTPPASAAEYDVTLGFGRQYLVPAFGPARSLESDFGPVISFSVASPGSRLAVVGLSGIWHFVGGSDEALAVSLAPFLAGGEYAALRRGRASVVARLLAGGVWLKVRTTEREADPPFEEARVTDRSLRLGGNAALLLRVALTRTMSFESGVAVDLLYFEESDYPGFIGVPFNLVARF